LTPSDGSKGTTTRRGRTAQPRQVGRPRQKGKAGAAANPRDEILKAAASLFSLKGYAGTTMAEIADAVGIRGPSLYYHFSDKADVLKALAGVGLSLASEGLQDPRRSTAPQRPDKPHSVASRLYQLVHEVVFQLRSSPYELNCLFDPAFHTKEFSDVNKRLRTWMKDVEAIIRSGIADGDFVADDARIATYTVRGLVESAIRELGGYKSFTAAQISDYVANFTLRALLRDQSRLGTIRAELGYAA
jgi:AcrR family transcriptional regulator